MISPLPSDREEYTRAWREPGRVSGMELVRTHRQRLKALSGFAKGAHFVPERETQAARRFLGKISEEEVSQCACEATAAIRDAFGMGAEQYEMDVEPGRAHFDCELGVYRCESSYDPEDLSQVIFTQRLSPKRQWEKGEWRALYDAIGPFEKLILYLADPMELREFAVLVEAGPVGTSGYPQISYPSSLERVELLFPDGGSLFCFRGDRIEISFGAAQDPFEASWEVMSSLVCGFDIV